MKMKDCVIGEMYIIDTSKVNDWSLKYLGSNEYVVQYDGYDESKTQWPFRFKVIMGTNASVPFRFSNVSPGKLIHFNGGERIQLKAL
jgi:hypothetical protein